MTTRVKLLESIAKTIADYRKGEISQPSPKHVEKWVNQFREDIQEPLLREIDHVLKHTYFNRDWVVAFLTRQVKNKNLAGENPCDFWKNANFLKIQQNGHSQEEMLEVFSEGLQAECGFSVEDCGSKDGPYMYLDDVLFTGSRVGGDLSKWLAQNATERGDVHILVIATHQFGE